MKGMNQGALLPFKDFDNLKLRFHLNPWYIRYLFKKLSFISLRLTQKLATFVYLQAFRKVLLLLLLYSNVYQIRGCRWAAGTGQICHWSRRSAVMMRSSRTRSEKRKSGLSSCNCRAVKTDLSRRRLKQGWVGKRAGSTRGWRKGAAIDV